MPNAGTLRLRRLCWQVRPDKEPMLRVPHFCPVLAEVGIFPKMRGEGDHPSTIRHLSDTNVRPTRPYALLRGRVVKSRICVRMLDICIPFSDETNGIISAMNGSFINSAISS